MKSAILENKTNDGVEIYYNENLKEISVWVEVDEFDKQFVIDKSKLKSFIDILTEIYENIE